jgi:hypothetical protein
MQFHPLAYMVKLNIESRKHYFSYYSIVYSKSCLNYPINLYTSQVLVYLLAFGTRSIDRILVSMADLIAKVSRTNTSWKDPSLSHSQNTSHIKSGHHDTQSKVNRLSKPSNLKSHNLSSSSSEIQLDDFSDIGEAPSRAIGLEANTSNHPQVRIRRRSLGASVKEGSEVELGYVVRLMEEDTEALTAEHRGEAMKTARRRLSAIM